MNRCPHVLLSEKKPVVELYVLPIHNTDIKKQVTFNICISMITLQEKYLENVHTG